MKAKYITLAAAISVAAIVSAPAQANALQTSTTNNPTFDFLNLTTTPRPLFYQEQSISIVQAPEPKVEPKQEEKPPSTKPAEDRKYTVKAGDNLSKIAEENGTTWPRLWNKNTDLDNPDLILVGQVILIPPEDAVLKDRPIPNAQPVQNAAQGGQSAPRTYTTAGNTYAPGNCTWYVKNRRPDLPNRLGNANAWYSSAIAHGLPVGSTPRAGAVGTTTAGDLGHVVYVESVNGDGTITISEMNFAGLYSQRTRTANASEFLYIY